MLINTEKLCLQLYLHVSLQDGLTRACQLVVPNSDLLMASYACSKLRSG